VVSYAASKSAVVESELGGSSVRELFNCGRKYRRLRKSESVLNGTLSSAVTQTCLRMREADTNTRHRHRSATL